MVSTQTLKLLDALLSGSSGSELEKLKMLYKQAYCDTEGFKNLKTLLERSEFHGQGQLLLKESEEVIQAGFTDAGSFGDRITVMESLVEKIRKERELSAQYVHSANVAGAPMNVIDKKLADGATEYYEALFQYVCCLYIGLYGDAVLKDFNVKTGIRSVDLIRNTSEELSMLIARAHRLPAPKCWAIVRKRFAGLNAVPYDGFILEYGDIGIKTLNEAATRIAPTLFVPKHDASVLCCGIGYLTSLDVTSGGTLYGAQVTTKPALNCLDQLDLNYRDLHISLLLDKIAGGNVCVLHPEALVELLNRYFMNKAVKKNRETGCPLCGKDSCSHYSINEKFPQ